MARCTAALSMLRKLYMLERSHQPAQPPCKQVHVLADATQPLHVRYMQRKVCSRQHSVHSLCSSYEGEGSSSQPASARGGPC